jgi:isoleucyl-tRNA synthetase
MLDGIPPYKGLLTHGFVVDGEGRKMSKSKGNVVAPQQVSNTLGAEILRLWVASSDYRGDISYGKEIFARIIESYRKIRNTFRYLLGNLYDFDPATDRVEVGALQEVDRFALARYADAARAVIDAYESYEFPVIFQRLNQLMTVDLSAFHADVSKDRLYTFGAASADRRSAQTAMYVMADGLARLLAPILVVTADEMWKHLPGRREESVHIAEFPSKASIDALRDDRLVERWEGLLAVRNDVNRALESARQSKTIGTSLAAHVRLRVRGATAALLEPYRDQLPMLFIVSQVDLDTAAGDGPELEIDVTRAEGDKCPRCWRMVPSVSTAPDTLGLCDRCMGALPSAAGRLAG